MKCLANRRRECTSFAVALCLLCAEASGSRAGDWLTLPSTYTHSPVTGERVHQYAAVVAPPQTDQSSLIVSGYTHYRSSIQYGQSADNYHRVNQWGPPVRPYGEWQFPYRPYSAPYSAWGAPFAGLGFGGGFLPGVGFPGGGDGSPGYGDPVSGYPGSGYPGGRHPGYPGSGYPGGGDGGGIPGQPYHPYPANPTGPYPVPPWYDGYQPDYPVTQPLNDRDFFAAPRQRP